MNRLYHILKNISLPSIIGRGWGWVCCLLLLTACNDELDQQRLTQAQQALIGRGVNFNASYATPFETRATSYRHDGSFNEEDIMTIYRQYSYNNGLSFDETEANTAYRVYWFKTKYATGTTTVSLGDEWIPKAGEKGYDPERSPKLFEQGKGDSLTWDNGNTVRFKAWSRSNLDGSINNSKGKDNKYRYYPDYCVSEWVTVSGPTDNVSLTMRHQGCRIGIITKAGNELARAEICTDIEDYMREDNSTDYAHDESSSEHGKTREQAQEELDQVMAVYNQMCMPAGVDINTSLLTTMTKAKYEDDNTDLSKIHQETDGIVKFGTQDDEYIKDNVQHPLFCSNNGRLYMVTIPYNMSSKSGAHSGEALKLPACTRFKIWLYDVNSGDKKTYTGEESTYHILTLGDVKRRGESTPMFPDGLELKAGYSYLFSVGYYYDQFTVTPADDFAWVDDQEKNVDGIDKAVDPGTSSNYEWWTSAIETAVASATEHASVGYHPVFEIDTPEEFVEFIKLVNGTAATKTSGLTGVVKKVIDPGTQKETKVTDWYKDEDMDGAKPKKGASPIDKASAEAEGYIFYQRFIPADATNPADYVEDYVRGPYSFYDANLGEHFVVKITADIDMNDWKIPAIGYYNSDTDKAAFRGVLDGCHEVKDASGKVVSADAVYTLKNINVEGGYLFNYCQDVAIRNLKIETTHDFKLVKTAEAGSSTGFGAYLVGISIKAPSNGNPLATTLRGSSYVTGCIYQGRATGAMIGEANNLNMVGCMMAAEGLAAGTGALLGNYINANDKFFAPQTSKKVSWGRFMVNYYDTGLSPGTNAVGSIADAYKPQQYIRGSYSYILKAKNDNFIGDEVDWQKNLTDEMRRGYYGLAPWKALNYAIRQYNKVGDTVGSAQNCYLHFENNSDGYVHRYPELVAGAPTDDMVKDWNVLEQNN